ncbi:hypothetical protein [Arcobacter roscoffensis]|uniref:DNA-binding protein n=1 Tax=Arcobacter roscoffensis TaxID=2961520 RepID=A0ABY5E108_9BACT|nr:hypothetical protein [Arcobacter roscoffensis]UTJ05406.1 hypothetical protein NJU99_09005 [Arcobacter roscoffensis]
MKHNNQIKENKDFHAKLKSSVIAYANDKGVTWSCYFGDLLFPNSPTGAEQVNKAFNTTNLTSWQVALILQEIGEYAYPIITTQKVEKYDSESEFKNAVLETMGELGSLTEKATKILDDEDTSLDTYEAKKLARCTQKLLVQTLKLHLKTEKAKDWE